MQDISPTPHSLERRRLRARRNNRLLLIVLIFAAALTAAGLITVLLLQPASEPPLPTVLPARAQLATRAPTRAPSPSPSPSSTPIPIRLAVGGDVPTFVRTAVNQWATTNPVVVVAPGQAAALTISASAEQGGALLAERVFVVADWFPTLRTGITLDEIRALYSGSATADGASTLLVTDDAAEMLAHLYGAPAASVKVMAFDALVNELWQDPAALAVVPFDRLTVKLTALPLDGESVLSHNLDQADYPLVARAYVSGDSTRVTRFANDLHLKLPLTNRDPDRITTLIMTGTTAIARTSAYKIEQYKDPAYPARIVGPLLASADITHISNEISVADNCVPVLNTMSFCSKPSYLATFKLAGVDIVGLTGNHLLDYGTAPFLKTLDIYDQAGLRYYGGGRNATEAGQTLYLQDHRNRLAFIGANNFGPVSDWATAKQPGANKYDAAAMKKAIEQARARSDVVFVEMQAEESYDYQPPPNNQVLFRLLSNEGPDVVTGVQAHQPQAIEFSEDGRRIILYGLGNLFFDQMFDIGVRQELIARHTIYAGHLIQTELLTAMLEDYVQPRWATPQEQLQILNAVFGASGFKRP